MTNRTKASRSHITRLRYELGLISFFRNEAHILREWIEHHLRFGVEHFYLCNNGSTDSSAEILKDYQRYVSVFDVPGTKYRDGIATAYARARQECAWVANNDMDEFLYSQNHDTIPAFLATIDKTVGVVSVSWKKFLPNGNLNQPKSVIDRCTLRVVRDSYSGKPYKSIFNTKLVSRIGNHQAPKDTNYKTVRINIEHQVLQINHYRYQSYEYCLGIKVSRGGYHNKTRYKAKSIRKMLNADFATGLVIDTDLAERSKRLIEKINNLKQVRPETELYDNDLWTAVGQISTKEIDHITDPIELDKKLYREYILPLLK